MTLLATGLIRIARAIGRWILRRLIRKGIDMLVGYMDGKVEDFHRRRARARSDLRVKWLTGRIRRWRAAIKWLLERRSGITRAVAQRVDDEVGRHLPMAANDEKYERWLVRRNGAA